MGGYYMNNLEELTQKIMTDFFKGLSQDMTEEKYNALYSDTKSPLTNLYSWGTDNYAVAPLFRSDKKTCDSSESFRINTLNDVVKAVKYALNNNTGYDDFESYSDYLHIALFKYQAVSLDIREMHKNCIELHLKLSGFNWLDVDNRYFEEDVFVYIPLKYLFNKKVVYKLILDGVMQATQNVGDVFEDMFDIDNLEYLGISNFTISLSSVWRKDLDRAMRDAQDSGNLKAILSFMTDSEVIAYRDSETDVWDKHYHTDDEVYIDCLRIYFMFVMYNKSFSANAFKNYILASRIQLSREDKAVFDYVETYLNARHGIEYNSYINTYCDSEKYRPLWSSFDSAYCSSKIKTLFDNKYITQEGYNYYLTFVDKVMEGMLI